MDWLLFIAGWVATLLIIVGCWRIAYKERYSLLLGIAGGAIWAVKGAMTGQVDLLVLQSLLCVLQLNAWIKWGKST